MAPTQGRTVLFRISETCTRPAVVVAVNNPGIRNSKVNLQVFLDGTNDFFVPSDHDPKVPMFLPDECKHGIAWRTSVPMGDGIGEWSWPQKEN